ncbi:MAG: hypothetical protein ACLRVQ_02865 [Lachnospiraceae bacterium]
MAKCRIVRKIISLGISAVMIVTMSVSSFAGMVTETKPTAEFGTFQGRSIMNSGVSKTIKLDVASGQLPMGKYVLKADISYYNVNGNTLITSKSFEKSNPTTMLFTKTIDLYGYYNQYTNSNDGFRTTPVKCYSTHEARGTGSVAVYITNSL